MTTTSPETNLAPRLSQWTVQALTRLLATYAVVQGVGIILGGRVRWESKALQLALSVPGAPATWGWVLLGFGGVVLPLTFLPFTVRRVQALLVSMWGIGAWSFFFCLSMVPSILTRGSHLSTTGGPTYAFIGIAAAVLGLAYRRSA